MNRISLLVAREFRERVHKKSFIITTILTPLLMIALMVAPSLIMLGGKSDTKKVAVLDRTEGKTIMQSLQSGATVAFEEAAVSPDDLSAARAAYGSDSWYGILVIGSDIVDNTSSLQLIINDSPVMSVDEAIQNQVQDAIRQARLARYDIEDMDRILSDANVRISSIQTLKNSSADDDSMEETSSDISFALGIILGMMLYFILIVYGSQVLSSVIEEKQSRVLDVMVTSCTPTELMLGKIFGIALVAALQIVIWAVLILSVSAFVMPALMSGSTMTAGAGSADIFSHLTSVSFMSGLFLELFLYIVGGFLFYAAMYAAVGSAVDNPQDAGQFNLIIMMPIILAIMVMMNIMNNPDSGIVFWCSMIPFTSPVVMMARIPFGVPVWQVAVSIAVLFISFFLMAWIAGRIFRVGVFMHGKKPTWKDLGAWIRMK